MEQEATAGLRLTKDEADVMAELSEGPLRVNRVVLTWCRPLPVFPAQRTSSAPAVMSQTCQLLTRAVQHGFQFMPSAGRATDVA